MKRNELHNFIKEEIINILSEDASADKAAQDAKKVAIDKEIVALQKKKSEVAKSPSSLEEDNVNEMARTPNNVKVGDPAKMAIAKKLYSGTWKGDMLDVVEKAGEEGISQIELAKAVGKTSQPAINPSVNEFLKIGAFALSKSTTPKVADKEETPIEEPENDIEEPTLDTSKEDDEDVEVKDDWEKSEDEDETPEEPKAADIKAVEKSTGGKEYAQKLSPEDEEKYSKLRKGIESKVNKLRDISKAKRIESDDFKVLKQIINRDDVKKLFKAKGIDLADIVSDVMG